MSKPSLVIQPIDFDVATRAIDKFSNERQIPSMVYPLAGAGEGASKQPASSAAQVLVPPSGAPRQRRSVQRIPVELPEYVVDDIKRRALAGRCSARHIIMKALRAHGLHIADDDMPEDGRRIR